MSKKQTNVSYLTEIWILYHNPSQSMKQLYFRQFAINSRNSRKNTPLQLMKQHIFRQFAINTRKRKNITRMSLFTLIIINWPLITKNKITKIRGQFAINSRNSRKHTPLQLMKQHNFRQFAINLRNFRKHTPLQLMKQHNFRQFAINSRNSRKKHSFATHEAT